MSGRFAFIESNTTGTGVRAVHRLLARGDEVVFFTRTPEKYPLLAGAAGELKLVQADTNDVDGMTGEVARLQRERPLDALVTFSEFYVPMVATVAERCALRALSPRAATACRDKFSTRRHLAAAGRATPRFRLVASEDEARAAGAEVGYPCIVKPPADSSSKGVLLVAGEEELVAQFRRLNAWAVNDRGQALTGQVLIESVLRGPEVSVETMTLGADRTQVVGITAKHLSQPPLFVEIGHDYPAALAPAEAARIEEEVQAALAAVGFDFGPAHTEVRLTPEGPVVVEINPRLAGGMIPELVRHAQGIDLLSAYFDLLAGRPVDLAARQEGWASIRFLLAGRSGRLTGVAGLEEARSLALVREATLGKALGSSVRPAQEAADRLGYVIASGASRADVLSAVDRALASIELQITSPEG
ncbi:MAG TPA: ATP-grasp domain-containing protein [Thermoanaerobaculia bacterium]